MITLDDLKSLQVGDYIMIPRRNGPEKWKVNGQVKTWKRDAGRVRVPLKHGLYNYDQVTELSLGILNDRAAYIEKRGY